MVWLYHRIMGLKDADGIANSVDLDQTAPLTPFAQALLVRKLMLDGAIREECLDSYPEYLTRTRK